jgi:predicted nucleic-acid-binding protein
MLAVDTNVIVRLLVDDDPVQAPLARRLFEQNDIWVSVTVLLECALVLRSAYGMSARRSAGLLRGLLGLDNVRVEDVDSVARAIDAVRGGLELADALHLARVPVGVEFVTFDKALVKAGQGLGRSRLV